MLPEHSFQGSVALTVVGRGVQLSYAQHTTQIQDEM